MDLDAAEDARLATLGYKAEVSGTIRSRRTRADQARLTVQARIVCPAELHNRGMTDLLQHQSCDIQFRNVHRQLLTSRRTLSSYPPQMGVAFSIAGTIDAPMLLGGPASVVFCWLLGSVMCMTLALSIAELVVSTFQKRLETSG